MSMRAFLLGLGMALALLPEATDPVLAQAGRSTGLPLPRFVSLTDDRVNVRFGPGKQYPINWVFARKGLPVEIIQEFDTWRKVRDYEGDEGWIHSSLLSSRRTIMISTEEAELRRTPSLDSRVVARVEQNVLGSLFDCSGEWCRVEIEGKRGWLERSAFWGTLPSEQIE